MSEKPADSNQQLAFSDQQGADSLYERCQAMAEIMGQVGDSAADIAQRITAFGEHYNGVDESAMRAIEIHQRFEPLYWADFWRHWARR